ncbi:MAG: ATP-binding cassette domain-containing protein, partial [Mesorhizobium sp.]
MQVNLQNLRVAFQSAQGPVEAVKGVSLCVGREKVGIVGESGSGKSLTARSILKLLPKQADLSADELTFDGIDVLGASERAMRRIRGKRAGLIM